MDRIRVSGGRQLNGVLPISGAKNAALPLLIASMLTDEPLIVENVPRLADVQHLVHLLANHGVDVTMRGRRSKQAGLNAQTLRLRARKIVDITAHYEWVRKMRASFWVIAPLLARCGEARVSLPGGCAIGTRPIDFYLDGLKTMGADITIEQGYVIAKAKAGLEGGHIALPKPSVGATNVLMMAASLARGTTIIDNAACEPEITNVGQCLNLMGASIEGIGTNRLIIEGCDRLNGARCRVIPDRIETGTYMSAVAMTGGKVLLEGANREDLILPIKVFESTGLEVRQLATGLQIKSSGARSRPTNIITKPFPGFPTDLQAQFMALMTKADGDTEIIETIFDNRFMHVQELVRLGANIRLDGQRAQITGVDQLTGTDVMATDLRASVSLVIAGLAAKGDTTIHRVYHLDRGFERLESKLQACGAKIERLSQ